MADRTAYLRHMEQRMVRMVGESGVLGRWMETLFPVEQVAYVWALYRVGALSDGRTVFFYVTREGYTVDAKVMAYGPNGHRVKIEDSRLKIEDSSIINCQLSIINSRTPPVSWLHALDRLERPLALPLFGEHLADTLPFAPLGLVESEKTALVAKLWRPDCTWLATGGKSCFTAERLRVLSGRSVTVWPDADAIGEWMEAAATLGPALNIGFRFPSTYLNRIREGPPKGDLADLIVATKTTKNST
ncbi:MAG: hypothetical protein IKS80_04735 [Bacteroidaceae bacterium]|nr:hypothetical protein [Bacteroidaceae bacterium]